MMLEFYLNMIVNMCNEYYIPYKGNKYKLIVFCGTVVMCEAVERRLQAKYRELDVRKYTQGDPYDNVIDADIRVTTIKSAGRAIDIPNLITVINTMATNSKADNLQLVGRLRDIKNVTVRSVMLWSNAIKRHNDYKRNLTRLFMAKAKKILTDIYR